MVKAYLNNKFNISEYDLERFNVLERMHTMSRIIEIQSKPEILKGDFSLEHLQATHKYIFQDVYPWAGEIRQVNIAKNHFSFANHFQIEAMGHALFDQLKKDNLLKGLDAATFSEKAGLLMADINVLHPFREGNGRSTRAFMENVARNAGWDLNFEEIDKNVLFNAMVKSAVDESQLVNLILENISGKERLPELEGVLEAKMKRPRSRGR